MHRAIRPRSCLPGTAAQVHRLSCLPRPRGSSPARWRRSAGLPRAVSLPAPAATFKPSFVHPSLTHQGREIHILIFLHQALFFLLCFGRLAFPWRGGSVRVTWPGCRRGARCGTVLHIEGIELSLCRGRPCRMWYRWGRAFSKLEVSLQPTNHVVNNLTEVRAPTESCSCNKSLQQGLALPPCLKQLPKFITNII